MLRPTSILRGLVIVGISFLAPAVLLAQSNSPLYWDITGTGLWGAATNWNTDPTGSGGTVGVPVDPINDAVFSGSLFAGATTVQLDAPESALGLYFQNSGATTLASSSATSEPLTIGTDGITVSATSGAVTLGDGTNAMPIVIRGSETWLNNNTSNTLAVVNGVSDLAASTLTIDGPGNTTLSGIVSDGGGALQLLKTGAGTLSLGGASTFTGGLTISQGTVIDTNAGGFGAGTITLGDANTGSNNPTLFHQSGADTAATHVIVGAVSGGGLPLIKFSADWSGSGSSNAGSPDDLVFTLDGEVNFECTSGGKQITPYVTGTGVAAGNVAVKVDGGTQVTWTAAENAAATGVIQNDFTGNVWITGNTKLQTQNRAYQSNTAPWYNGVIPDTATVIIDAGSTWQQHHGAETVAFISGAGTVAVGTGTNGNQLTLDGNSDTPSTSPTTLGFASFSGTFSTNQAPLIMAGTGTQELSGSGITFNAGVNLNNGTLRLTNTTAWASAVTFGASNAPVLQLNAAAAADNWTFNRQINGGSSAAVVEKIGPGTVNLSPASGSTFIGSSTAALKVTAGTLYVNSAFGTPPAVTVQGTARLGGTVAVGATTIADSGILEGGQGGSGSLTMSSLTFDGAASLIASPSATTTPLIVNGALTTGADAGSITISFGSLPAASGTYHLIQYGSLGGLGFDAFTVADSGRTVTLQNDTGATNYIDVVVGSAAYPIWTGINSSAWTGSNNWKLSTDSSTTDFQPLDNVVFDDSALGTTTVDVNANVNPSSTTFDFGTTIPSYTLQGSGSITSGSFTKMGSGTLTISNDNNTFAGEADLNGGVTVVDSLPNQGAAGPLGAGSLAFGGGTLEYTGARPRPTVM